MLTYQFLLLSAALILMASWWYSRKRLRGGRVVAAPMATGTLGFVGGLGVGILLMYCLSQDWSFLVRAEPPDYGPLPVGSALPDIKVDEWINGSAALANSRGQVLVIDVWSV